jgi:hypothetical protein
MSYNNAFKDLDTIFIALLDLHMNLYRISGSKTGKIGSKLRVFDCPP